MVVIHNKQSGAPQTFKNLKNLLINNKFLMAWNKYNLSTRLLIKLIFIYRQLKTGYLDDVFIIYLFIFISLIFIAFTFIYIFIFIINIINIFIILHRLDCQV